MRPLSLKLDRPLTLGLLVLIASALLLIVGLLSVFTALGDDGADLPQQGTIDQILDETSQGDSSSLAGDAPAGPPPPAPVRFAIPRLYIDAPVVAKGLTPENYPEVPDRPDQVAWYPFTAAPGQSSNAVFSGHVDWQTRTGDPIPGVFYRLREMELGDTIDVTLEDGTKLEYRVTGNVATPYDDPNVVKVMQSTDRDVITVITCGGSWIRDPGSAYGGNYSHRVVVRAERTQGLAESGTGGG